MQDAPPWVLQQLTQSKAYKRLNKQNKKHKTWGIPPSANNGMPYRGQWHTNPGRGKSTAANKTNRKPQ